MSKIERMILSIGIVLIIGVLFYINSLKFVRDHRATQPSPSEILDQPDPSNINSYLETKKRPPVTFTSQFACAIQDESLLDDGSGFYNTLTGFNYSGIVQTKIYSLKETRARYWQLFKDQSVDNQSCYEISHRFQDHLKNYWPDTCHDQLAKCPDKICREIIQYYCYHIAEWNCQYTTCKRYDHVLDQQIRTCRKHVYHHIVSRYYEGRDSELIRVYQKTQKIAKDIITSEFPHNKTEFISALDSLYFYTREYFSSTDLNEGLAFLEGYLQSDNAFFFENTRGTNIVMGLSLIERNRSAYVAAAILAHEIGHAFDPINLAKKYCPQTHGAIEEKPPDGDTDDDTHADTTVTSKFRNRWLTDLTTLPDPFTCQAVPRKVQIITQVIMEDIDFSRYEYVRFGKSYPYNYAGEIFADWFAAKVLNRLLPKTKEIRRRLLLNLLRVGCDTQYPMEDGIHLTWNDRIQQIYQVYLTR